jgi:hypothetical protein
MTVTFQVEGITDLRHEAMPLLLKHWEEIALNKEVVRLDPDWDGYERLHNLGMLHVTTARADGALVGYASYLLAPNLHYRTMLVAEGDIFYLAIEQRKGTTGIRLLAEAERHLKARARADKRGFENVYIINKEKAHFTRPDGRSIVGPVLKHLGYNLIEHYHAKRVGLV